jgi:hypothetical protein
LARRPRHSHVSLRPCLEIAVRKRIIRNVEDVIQRNAPDDGQEILHAEFMECLDRPDSEDDIANRSVAAIITDIGRDLGIAASSSGWSAARPPSVLRASPSTSICPTCSPPMSAMGISLASFGCSIGFAPRQNLLA